MALFQKMRDSALRRIGLTVFLAICLLLTFVFWYREREDNRKRDIARFDAIVEQIEKAIDERFTAYETILRAARGFVQQSKFVSREDWKQFVDNLEVDKFYPGIEGITITEYVADSQKESFIESVKSSIDKNFRIFPEGSRPDYFVITHIEPMERTANALGFDVGSESIRRAAAERARDTGQPSLSRLIKLITKGGTKKDFLYLSPIYESGADINNADQRKTAFRGFVTIGFRAEILVQKILGAARPDAKIELFDGEQPDNEKLFFKSGFAESISESNRAPHIRITKLVIGGSPWTLRVTSNSVFTQTAAEETEYMILITGIVLSFALWGMGNTLISGQAKAEMLAMKMTSALRESEERYRQLFSGSKAVELLIDPQTGDIIDANTAAAEYYGYSVDTLKTLKIFDINTMPKEEMIAEMKRPITTNNNHFFFRHRLASGVVRDVEVHSGPIVVAGKTILYSIIHDITDRKKAEEERRRLFAAIEQAADVIIITDKNGAILYINPAFEKITGYASWEVIGRNPSIIKSGTKDPDFYKTMWETIKTGNVWSGHFVNRRKSGILYDAEATISPVIDEKGEIVNFVAVEHDVTFKRTLAKAKDYFTMITAHELRTPLTYLQLVKSLLDNIKTESPNTDIEEIKSALEKSYNNFERIISATTLLNTLSNPSAEKQFYQVFPYMILTAAAEHAKTMISREKREVDIALDLSRISSDVNFMGNQEMITRVIDELLSNAIKNTPDGGQVKISAKQTEALLMIDVLDEGVGIPKEYLEHLFEPYFGHQNPGFHSTGQYKFQGGGIGLGLALSKMIVNYHQGDLDIKSDGSGQGTTVMLKFKLEQSGQTY